MYCRVQRSALAAADLYDSKACRVNLKVQPASSAALSWSLANPGVNQPIWPCLSIRSDNGTCPPPPVGKEFCMGFGQFVACHANIHVAYINLLSADMLSGVKLVRNVLAAEVQPGPR